MRIGILTLTLHNNYGGILQAYALQTVLERMGHEVVVFNRPRKEQKLRYSQLPKRIVKKILGRDEVIFKEWRDTKEYPVVNKSIIDFRKKYIHERLIESFDDIKESEFDCIVVGSDQVWRPRYFKEQWQAGIENAFLSFAKKWDIKRFAYGASLGVDTWEFSKEETDNIKNAVKKFSGISVREMSAVELLREKLNVEVLQVLDPTLLLGKEHYIDLFNASKTQLSKGNLLVYLLNPDNEKLAFVDYVAKARCLTPYYIINSNITQKTPVELRIRPSIETWLRGFYDAQLVVTDSFHACAFSIIFGKSFYVLGNEERGMSRIHSLCHFFSDKGNSILDSNLPSFAIYKQSKDLDYNMFHSLRNISVSFLNIMLS